MARRGHLEGYLASLPEGLASIPACKVKGLVLDATLDWLAEVEATVDPALERAVRQCRPLGRALEWVPEVLLDAVSLQVAEDGYPSDESWLHDVYRRQRLVYSTPLYRALMMVLSPTLLTMGAADRWRAYRKGTELTMGGWTKTDEGRRATGTLHYPPGLHTELNVLSLGQAIVAAVDACGAKDTKLELLPESRPGQALLCMTYQA